MRLFFAIGLPSELQATMADIQGRIRGTGVAASWSHLEGLHLTLAFLGEVDEARASHLLAIAGRVLRTHAAFRLRTTVLGGFPRASAAKILWLGLEPQPALASLVADLQGGLRRETVFFDDRPFHPHLTLARFKTPQDVDRFEGPSGPMDLEVQQVGLFQSHPGNHYRSIGDLLLR